MNQDQLATMIAELYRTEHGASGGCNHIVLDDDNTEDENVWFCLGYASASHDSPYAPCVRIANALTMLSEAERIEVIELAWRLNR